MASATDQVDGALPWEVARPRWNDRFDGVAMAGFRDRGMVPDGHRLVPFPAVTVVFDFGTGPLVVEDEGPQQHQGSLVAGVGLGTDRGSAIHLRGNGLEAVQVRLSPLIAGAVLGMALCDLDDAIVPLSDVWGCEAKRTAERLSELASWGERFALVEDVLARRLRGAGLVVDRTVDPEVAWVWERILDSHGMARIDQLAGSIGWSRKRLWSRFVSRIGLSPKQAARLVRFDHVAHELAAGRPPARVAADSGYADQSHLHREIAAFTGVTPRTLAAEPFLAVDGHAWPGGVP